MLTGFIDLALPDRQQAQCRVAVVDGVAVVPVFRMLRRRGEQLVGVCRGLFGGAGIQSGLRQAIQGVETPYRVAASVSRSFAALSSSKFGTLRRNGFPRFSGSEKKTVGFVSAMTGCPLRSTGRNFHCFTASMAGCRKIWGPVRASAFVTFPCGSSVASSSTLPVTPWSRASGG